MADYKALVDTLLADYMAQYKEKAEAAKKAKAHDMAVIDAFNKNPRAYNDDEKMQIALAARNYGVPIAEGVSNDKATAWEKAKALGGGAVDSLLFGLLKNDWYSDDSTKGWADAGRIGGTAASLLMPWGVFGAAKGSMAILKAAKALGGANKLKNIKAIYDTANKAKLIQAAARLGYTYNAKPKPSFEDKAPDYTDEQKLKEFFLRYYGNSEAGMPATQ